MADKLEAKQFEPKLERTSVVDTPKVAERDSPHAHPIILQVAARSQTITPWGLDFKTRDKELSSFWKSESWLASVVYSVTIRNASFAWEIKGADPSKPRPKNTINRVTRILEQSNRGKGWQNLITKTCIDLYSRDNGAFWHIIRKGRGPNAPVINISHLDSLRCTRTGDPKYPVIYEDRYGKEHVLKWWQVRTIEEFPSPIESAFDTQICAVSRCLLAAEIIQSIAVYKQEKVSGQFTKAIDIVTNVTKQNIQDAIRLNKESMLNQGLYRYSIPVILPGVDPTSGLDHVHIDLASLPDNFDEDTSFKWYVAQLAAAFGVDYQEIAPLMVGTLGSSQQSDILHLKTRGKGPALVMRLFENIINDGLVPSNVRFDFLEQDLRAESEKAEARFTRAKERNLRVKSGELDAKAARELAVADGDLPEHMLDEIEERGEAQSQEFGQELTGTQLESGTVSHDQQKYTLKDYQLIRNLVSK